MLFFFIVSGGLEIVGVYIAAQERKEDVVRLSWECWQVVAPNSTPDLEMDGERK